MPLKLDEGKGDTIERTDSIVENYAEEEKEKERKREREKRYRKT